MVVIIGDVTIEPDQSSECTALRLVEWTTNSFPTLTGTPGGDVLRLSHHITMIYHKRGAPDEKFLRATQLAGIDQFSFTGRVNGILPVGDDKRGLIIMTFDLVQDMADASKHMWDHIIKETGETPKMTRRPEEIYKELHGFSAHITLASFADLTAATKALSEMKDNSLLAYTHLFHHKSVTLDNYRAIE